MTNYLEYRANIYDCAECGKKSMSKDLNRTICIECNEKTKPRCLHCKSKFYSSTGKQHCRNCRRLLGLLSPEANRQRLARALKSICSDPLVWERDIKLLQIKLKWGLFSHIDAFRVAHIYMDCICNADKYCTLDAMKQAEHMLAELATIIDQIKNKPPLKTRKPRKKRV